ncbi:MAG TPA: electron transfer flavoprotein subunit alpha/FixB family protein, partial [Polyangiales bacterium]|nr:electron transfer flavoprotein subunit alpha/FixB family protein [Polyangiales bacterium]
MTDVLVVAELLEGGLRKTTLNAITAARTIAQGTGGAFDVLAIGEGSKKAAGEVAAFGARKVLATEIAGGYRAEAYAATVAAAGKGYGVVLTTASTYGKDLLPRVAAKLGAGIASDISSVSAEGGKIVYKRPVYAGNVFATLEVTTPIQAVSVRQSEFEQASESGGSSPV